MACPLFIPTLPLSEIVAIAPPLGALFDGVCAAEPSAAIEPDILRRYCNYGYARGQCIRAGQTTADAVRFAVRGQDADTVEVAWAVESNHHPVAVGRISVNANCEAAPGNLLAGQVRACASAYLRQSACSVTEATAITARRTAGGVHP